LEAQAEREKERSNRELNREREKLRSNRERAVSTTAPPPPGLAINQQFIGYHDTSALQQHWLRHA
jgi:hypothetical protein